MAHVIIDRPRHDPGHGKGRPPRRLDDLPASEGMCRPHTLRGADKGFSDHPGPLKRYLRKQVGRPWNKVYSEICAHLHAGKPVDDHVRKHVADFVAFDVVMAADGTPTHAHRHTLRGTGPISQPFFVHPRSGRLRQTDRAGHRR